MNDEKNKIIETLDRIENVTELFYQENGAEAFDEFLNLLDDITQMIDIMSKYSEENTDFEYDDKKVYDILKQIMEALEDRDEVMLADILRYDFAEYMNECLQQIE